MRLLMKINLLAFLVLSLALPSHAATPKTKFKNLAVTGTLDVTGAETHAGAQTLTGAQSFVGTGGMVNVSTATTSSAKLCLVGAVAALPTSGYTSGCLAVLSTTMKLYISTETVAGTQSWVIVGQQ